MSEGTRRKTWLPLGCLGPGGGARILQVLAGPGGTRPLVQVLAGDREGPRPGPGQDGGPLAPGEGRRVHAQPGVSAGCAFGPLLSTLRFPHTFKRFQDSCSYTLCSFLMLSPPHYLLSMLPPHPPYSGASRCVRQGGRPQLVRLEEVLKET